MFNHTGWNYQTSAGVGLTVGELAEVTIQHTRIYVKSPSGDTFKIIGQGVGGGIGAGLIPGGITGSTADFKSAGTEIISIYNHPISLADLSSFLVIYQVTGVANIGAAAGSLVLFINGNYSDLAWLAVPFFGPSIVVGVTVKAFCFMAGLELASPNASIDLTGTLYSVLSADKV
jgi:hypothetical protein